VVDAKTLQVSQLAWTDVGTNPILVKNIGGTCTSRPSAVSWAAGRIDLFCRDANAVLSWSSLPSLSSNWTGWKPVEGTGVIANEPSAISRSNGTLDVFVQTATNTIAFANYDGQNWVWQDLGGSMGGPPKAFVDYVLRINVFAMDQSGALMHMFWDQGNGTFNSTSQPEDSWENLGVPS